MKYPVRFLREQITLEVDSGTTLLDALRQAGLQPDAPCSGRGLCGKCTVILEDSRGRRQVRACQTRVEGPLTLDTGGREQDHVILSGGPDTRFRIDPVCRRGAVNLPPAQAGQSHARRLKLALEAHFGESMDWIRPDLGLASELYGLLRDCDTLHVILGASGLLSISREPVPCYAVALDIGTTTLVGYLLDPDTGRHLATCSRINPQTQYGADVILRADYAAKHGTAPLTDCLRSSLRELVESLAREAGICREHIFSICAVGNTCMHHLLLGISPASLVRAPYSPVLEEMLVCPARELELPIHPRGEVILLPNIAGFLGADTMACLLCTRPDLSEGVTLMLDIGTNGELVLGSREGILACSTAAGPAFEGANIECGMRGARGAVDHVALEQGRFRFTTLGDQAPGGICGSGLIDLTACLLDADLLSPTGVLKVPGERFLLSEDPPVYITQKDIRQLQLAKAAIAAGIRVLLQQAGLTPSHVDRVLVAGAFGSYMDPRSACRIGLIPPQLRQKVRPIGNAAGEGAALALLDRRTLADSRALAERITFTELASSPDFQEYFVDELEFPREIP